MPNLTLPVEAKHIASSASIYIGRLEALLSVLCERLDSGTHEHSLAELGMDVASSYGAEMTRLAQFESRDHVIDRDLATGETRHA